MNWIYKNILTVVNCPALNLQNGQVSYTTPPVSNGGYSENTVATFMCNYGYNQTGSQSSTCGVSGDWDEQTPTCTQGNYRFDEYINSTKTIGQVNRPQKAAYNSNYIHWCKHNYLKATVQIYELIIVTVICATLDLANGQLNYNDSLVTNQGYPVATMATLTCNHGYALAGSASSLCQTSGEWEQPEPNCNLGKPLKLISINTAFITIFKWITIKRRFDRHFAFILQLGLVHSLLETQSI